MTPAQYYALASAWRDKQRREDYRFGVLTWVIRKVVGDKEAEPMDFFGGSKPKHSRKTAKQREAELRAYIEAKKKAQEQKS